MELDDQIYVNVEELRATSSPKHSGPVETGRPVKHHITTYIAFTHL